MTSRNDEADAARAAIGITISVPNFPADSALWNGPARELRADSLRRSAPPSSPPSSPQNVRASMRPIVSLVTP